MVQEVNLGVTEIQDYPKDYQSFANVIIRPTEREVDQDDVHLLYSECMKSLDSLNDRRIELDKLYWTLSSAAVLAASYMYVNSDKAQFKDLIGPALFFGLIVTLAWIVTQMHHDYIRDRKTAIICKLEQHLTLAPMQAEVRLAFDAETQYEKHHSRYFATAIQGVLVMLMFVFLLFIKAVNR